MKVSVILGAVLFGGSIFAAPQDNGGLARRLERRDINRATKTTNPLRVLSTAHITDADNITHVEYSSNWAGAVLSAPPPGQTFNAVSGQFVVPSPSVPPGGGSGTYAAAIWVGIDGESYSKAIWQAGVDVIITDGEESFIAWYEWYPDPSIDIPGFSVSAGDTVSIDITSISKSSGLVILENISTGQVVTKSGSAPSTSAVLGGQNAEWIVEDFQVNGALVPFADFGTVLFTNAVASTSSQFLDTSGATIIELQDSKGRILTDVTIPSSSEVQIVYR